MTGTLLIVYVAVIIIVGMLPNNMIDKPTMFTIQSTLDLPTAVALITYAILVVKLEIDKPKYRYVQKSRESIDILLIGCGALLILGLIYLKYFI